LLLSEQEKIDSTGAGYTETDEWPCLSSLSSRNRPTTQTRRSRALGIKKPVSADSTPAGVPAAAAAAVSINADCWGARPELSRRATEQDCKRRIAIRCPTCQRGNLFDLFCSCQADPTAQIATDGLFLLLLAHPKSAFELAVSLLPAPLCVPSRISSPRFLRLPCRSRIDESPPATEHTLLLCKEKRRLEGIPPVLEPSLPCPLLDRRLAEIQLGN